MSFRILLLEDDPAVQQFIAAVLRKLSPFISTDLFANGDDALTRYHQGGPYDLVITDHGHLGLWGIEFIEAVRAIDANQPVLLQTGNTGEHIEDFERRWKDIPVLAKPWREEQFLQLVKALLRRGGKDLGSMYQSGDNTSLGF